MAHDDAALIGVLLAGSSSALGALLFAVPFRWSVRSQVLLLGLSAGILLGAALFAVLLPIVEAHGKGHGADLASAGLVLGALALWQVHKRLPHDHAGIAHDHHGPDLGKRNLFLLAFLTHNIAEGLAVGTGLAHAHDASGAGLALGVLLHGLPKGLAAATVLASTGIGRGAAIGLAVAVGLSELAAGLLALFVFAGIAAGLPALLGLAAGAFLYVVIGEIIPQTQRRGFEHLAPLTVVCGLALILWLEASLG